jgi:hypothetical protein
MTAANAQDDDLICLSISSSAFRNAHLAVKTNTRTKKVINPLKISKEKRKKNKGKIFMRYYRQQHKRRRLKWILSRQLNPPMINPSFKFSLSWSSYSELPLKYILLLKMKKNITKTQN